jgi:squalene cyclase
MHYVWCEGCTRVVMCWMYPMHSRTCFFVVEAVTPEGCWAVARGVPTTDGELGGGTASADIKPVCRTLYPSIRKYSYFGDACGQETRRNTW